MTICVLTGDATYSTAHMYGTYATMVGHDVPAGWLEQHVAFAKACGSDFYAFATERGKKEKNYMCKVFWFASTIAQKQL